MNIVEYIDSYFQKTLSVEERRVFETRCEQDTAFAQEVAFFITARQTLHEELLQQKQDTWKAKNIDDEIPVIPFRKKSFASRWVTYAAAACLVLAASVYLFELNSSPRMLADGYIKKNYATLGQTMSADSDNIALGIGAYNNKKYDIALQYFKAVENHDQFNSDAKQYAGLSYLQKDEYDSALMQFDQLANMKKLFSNNGDFLKALTLMKRNKPGDKETAKKLLNKVITENEAENEKAKEWVKKI